MPGPGVTVCSYLHLDISRSDVAVWMPLSLLGFLHPGWKLLFHVATASRCIFMQVTKLEWERWRCDRQITLWQRRGEDVPSEARTRRSSAICGHRVCCTERRSSETWNRSRFVFRVLFSKFLVLLLLFTRGPLPRHQRESRYTTPTATVTHPG